MNTCSKTFTLKVTNACDPNFWVCANPIRYRIKNYVPTLFFCPPNQPLSLDPAWTGGLPLRVICGDPATVVYEGINAFGVHDVSLNGQQVAPRDVADMGRVGGPLDSGGDFPGVPVGTWFILIQRDPAMAIPYVVWAGILPGSEALSSPACGVYTRFDAYQPFGTPQPPCDVAVATITIEEYTP